MLHEVESLQYDRTFIEFINFSFRNAWTIIPKESTIKCVERQREAKRTLVKFGTDLDRRHFTASGLLLTKMIGTLIEEYFDRRILMFLSEKKSQNIKLHILRTLLKNAGVVSSDMIMGWTYRRRFYRCLERLLNMKLIEKRGKSYFLTIDGFQIINQIEDTYQKLCKSPFIIRDGLTPSEKIVEFVHTHDFIREVRKGVGRESNVLALIPSSLKFFLTAPTRFKHFGLDILGGPAWEGKFFVPLFIDPPINIHPQSFICVNVVGRSEKSDDFFSCLISGEASK